MTRILIYKQNGSGPFDLDLYKDEPLPLVYNADDYTNVAEKSSNYSKSFSIPGTKKNNQLMEMIFDVAVDSSFNPHLRTRCIIKQGTVDIFKGYLQLNEILKTEGNIVYEITVFSVSTNFKDVLGEKKILDIDISELDHGNINTTALYEAATAGTLGLSQALGANSYAGTAGATTTDVIRYPLVKYNTSGYYDSGTGRVKNPGGITDHCRPWIKVWYLLNRIINEAGFTYTSSFIDSTDFKNLYVDLNNAQITNTTTGGFGMVRYFDVDTPTGTYADSTYHKIDFTNITNASANIVGSTYYNTSTDIFTFVSTVGGGMGHAPFLAGVTINPTWSGGGTKHFSLTIEPAPGNTGAWASMIPVSHTWYTVSSGDTKTWSSCTLNWLCTIAMNATGTGTLVFKIRSLPVSGSGGSTADVTYTSDTKINIGIFGNGISMNANLLNGKGQLSQWEFFKSLIDKFNLMVMEDPDDENNLEIVPYHEWITSGTTKNWSSRQLTDEIKIVPIDGLARKLNFIHAEDTEDVIYTTQNNPVKNFYSVEVDAGIEIADKDVEDIGPSAISNTFVSNYDSSTEFIIPHIMPIDPTQYTFDNVMRIMYNHGEITLSGNDFRVGSTISSDKYNLFTPVSDHPITAGSESLDFASLDYQYTNGGAVVDSLYNKYWARYIDELYDPSTRIIEMKMQLSNIDIFKHKFNDIILIENKKYRVLKIDYKPGHISKVTMVLIKDL